MVRKKIRTLLALAIAASMGISGSFSNGTGFSVSAADIDAQTSNQGVFKVELNESGTIVADNAASLEQQRFSWDNATVYFVLTDRFLNSDKSNDHSYGRGLQADGKTPVEGLDIYSNPGTFHGGDLNGLTKKVEEGYFNDLGVNAIWITAPYEQVHGFTSGNKKSNNASTYPDPEGGGFPYYSYHGYWALDYTNIDDNMGDEKDFEKFVDSCHSHGIRVVMDVVMNHVGYTTMQDAQDYGFDSALKGNWKQYYYGPAASLMGGDPECLNFWDTTSSAWSKWWGPSFVRADYPGYQAAGGGDLGMSLCGLPDVITEKGAPEGDTPPLLVNKWTKEGRLAQEQKELDDYFSKTGNKKQARYYIIKWLTDWVREYGVDGFRCDTAKHVDMDAWNDLKKEAVSALNEWRTNNSSKPGAGWKDDFWMTGEAWGHGMGRSPYYDNGFDSMINFTFPKNGNPAGMEDTYKNYASAINSDPTFNSLSYISSHDDCLTRGNMIGQGTSLLLAPGGVQIYYGDETNRPIGWETWFSSDYLDQRYRTDMNWDNIDQKVLSHWQKVGSFRNKHLSVGGGQHEMLSAEPYTFARTYHLEEEDEDKVVCSIPGKAGTYTVNVGDIFEDGETITDYYSGEKYEVSGGSVSVTCGENGVILLEGSGIVKASVSAKTKSKSTTYSSETFDITLRANKAKDTYYQINDGEKKAFSADDVLTIGGDTAYGEKTVITLTGVSTDDGSALSKEYTYQRSAEPTVSDGVFCVKVKKSEFPTAPNIFVYTNDTAETALNGAWPGGAMVQDDDADYWSFTNEEIPGDACIILSLGASSNTGGTWRSTPDKAKGLVAKGCMLYTKDATALEELPSGEPGKVTINYEDQDGNVLKTIYRVGVVGKNYTTYPAVIEGYELVTTPTNAKGTYETSSTVTYVYSNDPNATAKPTVSKTPSTSITPVTSKKPTETIEPDKTKEPAKTAEPGKTKEPETTKAPISSKEPSKTDTPSETKKPSNTPDSGSQNPTPKPQITNTPATTKPDVTSRPETNIKVERFTTNAGSSTQAYKKIQLTATASGGSGTYKFQFTVTNKKNNACTILQSYSAKNTTTWTPKNKGTYLLTANILDTLTGETATKTIDFEVSEAKFSLDSFTLKKNGKKLSISAHVIPLKGTVKYKFVIKNKKTKKVEKTYKYSTKKKYSYTFKKAGTYQVILYAKDSSGITISQTKTVKIK